MSTIFPYYEDDLIIEPIFLDLEINEVLYPRPGVQFEPWASMYVDALRHRRYGDAIWARYHIEGNVHNGIVDDTPFTVLEAIEMRALDELEDDEDQLFEDLLDLCTESSTADGHREVVELLLSLGMADTDDRQARYRRLTRFYRCEICRSRRELEAAGSLQP